MEWRSWDGIWFPPFPRALPKQRGHQGKGRGMGVMGRCLGRGTFRWTSFPAGPQTCQAHVAALSIYRIVLTGKQQIETTQSGTRDLHLPASCSEDQVLPRTCALKGSLVCISLEQTKHGEVKQVVQGHIGNSGSNSIFSCKCKDPRRRGFESHLGTGFQGLKGTT